MTAGVPQGSILGSFLYILYINDICNVTNKVHYVLYVDDTVILVFGPNLNELWHECIFIFGCYSRWFCSNKLALNDKKSKFLNFSSKKSLMQILKFHVLTIILYIVVNV